MDYQTIVSPEDWSWLIDHNIRVIDHRDPVGEERMHTKELQALEQTYGELRVPISHSGRCCRNGADATRMLASMIVDTRLQMAKWLLARNSKDRGKGGSCYYRPTLLVIDNYGIGLYSTDESRRTEYF